jgi:hypothetical protein
MGTSTIRKWRKAAVALKGEALALYFALRSDSGGEGVGGGGRLCLQPGDYPRLVPFPVRMTG